MLTVLFVLRVDMRATLAGAVQSTSTATAVRKHSSDCGCGFGQYASLTRGASFQLGVFAKLRGKCKGPTWG